MKRFTFLLILSSVILISCSRSESYDPSKPGSPAIMTVKLADNNTKAVGAPDYGLESQITTGAVFVFRGGSADPIVDGRATFDFSGGGTSVNVLITSGTNRLVYVLANIDTTTLGSITKRSDLLNLPVKAQLADMTGTALPMSGTEQVDASSASLTNIVPVTINLEFLASRVHILWEASGIAAPLVVTGVYLLNVKTESDYFAIDTLTRLTDNVLFYYYGRDNITGFTGQFLPVSPATTTQAPFLQIPPASLPTANGFENNYFYILENNDNFPTMVVIEGTLNGTNYFYPVIINGPQNGSGPGNVVNAGNRTSTVRRGIIYNVHAIIQGFGTSNPFEPLVQGVIQVEINTAVWTGPVIIDQEFL